MATFIFHAHAVDASSVISEDTTGTGANLDLFAVPTSKLSKMVATEDTVTLFFDDAKEVDLAAGTSASAALEGLDKLLVQLTVAEGQELTVIEDLSLLLAKGRGEVIKFDEVNDKYDIANVTDINILNNRDTTTLATDA